MKEFTEAEAVLNMCDKVLNLAPQTLDDDKSEQDATPKKKGRPPKSAKMDVQITGKMKKNAGATQLYQLAYVEGVRRHLNNEGAARVISEALKKEYNVSIDHSTISRGSLRSKIEAEENNIVQVTPLPPKRKGDKVNRKLTNETERTILEMLKAHRHLKLPVFLEEVMQFAGELYLCETEGKPDFEQFPEHAIDEWKKRARASVTKGWWRYADPH